MTNTYPNPDLETRLADLETSVSIGRRALDDRNRLLVTMSNAGYSNASLYHLLNRIRAEIDERPLSRCAIDKAILRHQPK